MFVSKYTVFVFFISSFCSIKPTLKNLNNDIDLSCIFNWEESKYYVLIEWVGRLGGKIFCLRLGQMDWVPWVHTSWPRVKFPSGPTSLSQELFLIKKKTYDHLSVENSVWTKIWHNYITSDSCEWDNNKKVSTIKDCHLFHFKCQ